MGTNIFNVKVHARADATSLLLTQNGQLPRTGPSLAETAQANLLAWELLIQLSVKKESVTETNYEMLESKNCLI